jgi:enterochelin esterase-like enzyme
MRCHSSPLMARLKGVLLLILLVLSGRSEAQFRPTPNDTLTSVRIAPDGRLTLCLFAPKADTVMLGGTDIPAPLPSRMMTKDSIGIWEVTLPPLTPGAYRYNFIVDGLQVLDPRNPAVSESNTNAWSLLYVPGADFMETKQVPHGAVSSVTYFSTSLGRSRRMHVYTPPGYESGKGKYPVLYLLHGAFDCDDSWSSVGRAGFILDNLIAAGRAKPMIVVMPAGHTGPFTFASIGRLSAREAKDEFVEDFLKDILPTTEKTYRVLTDRAHRAVAGLSMGGAQSLNIAIPSLSRFAYIGVFSSGIFELGGRGMGAPPPQAPSWEERNRASLEDATLKKGLRVLWFATGKDDFLLATTRNTVELFKKHGFNVQYEETPGAHTWENWRNYLARFAPLLFK